MADGRIKREPDMHLRVGREGTKTACGIVLEENPDTRASWRESRVGCKTCRVTGGALNAK